MNWFYKALLLILFFATPMLANAQQLRKAPPPAIRHFPISAQSEKLQIGNVIETLFSLEIPDQLSEIRTYSDQEGVYLAVRRRPQGIDAYGFGKNTLELIEKENIAKGFTTVRKNSIDFEHPYIVRRVDKSFEIESYNETTKIEKFFRILNELTAKKAIPKMNKQPLQETIYSNFEIGEALTFTPRKCDLWQLTIQIAKK